MDLWRVAAIVLRRWYVVLPLLAVVAWTASSVDGGVRPEQEVTATALVERGGASTTNNPYRTVEMASESIFIVLDGPGTRQAMADRGLIADYEIANPDRSPLVSFTVRAPSDDLGFATAQALIEAARAELEARQGAAGLPAEARYRLHVLSPPAVTATVGGGELRVQAVVVLLGTGLATAAAVAFDRAARRRSVPPSVRPTQPRRPAGRASSPLPAGGSR